MMREVGMATITFAGILISILTASLVITSEIETLTAILLLSKPVRRSEFIIGKFLGIFTAIILAFVFLSLVFIIGYWLKEGLPVIQQGMKEGKYLKPENSVYKDTWGFIKSDVLILLKGIYGCLLQVGVISSFATLFSIYFSLVLSGIGCFVILILGNISDYITLSLNVQGSFITKALGFIGSSFLPHFSILNTSSLVTTNTNISPTYLILTSLYTLVYVAFILYVTIAIFQKREIK